MFARSAIKRLDLTKPTRKMNAMLELEDALQRILALAPSAAAERVSVTDADRRVLAGPVVSPIDLPVFDNSAVDGYAVRAADVAAAAESAPVTLHLCGRVPAGESFSGEVPAGGCV